MTFFFRIVLHMRKFILASPIILLLFHPAHGQEITRDSTLQEVVVQAYTANRPLSEVSASIGYVSVQDLERFSNTSILPAVNTVPGARMEERSPGSYRFSI